MRNFVFVFLTVFVALAQRPAAQQEEVHKAEKSWAAAVVARDLAALEHIFHDQLIYAHSSGAVESKGEYIARLRTGAQKYDAIEFQDINLRMHGDAAIVHAHVRMKGQSNNRPFDNRLMMLHLWVKQGGSWHLAAHQTTELPK